MNTNINNNNNGEKGQRKLQTWKVPSRFMKTKYEKESNACFHV